MAPPPSQSSIPKVQLSDIDGAPFDYIIIGGGTSGCLLASRLAAAPVEPRHRVLLVEAGGEAEDQPDNLLPGLLVARYGNPASNWQYFTTPQKQLNDRRVFYPRGLGMGGSSQVNFSAWFRAPRCDWDEYARVVGDDWWRWDNVVEYMKKLEDFHPDCPAGMEKYYSPAAGMHQGGGPIGIGTGKEWQPLIKHLFQGCLEFGLPVNQDLNSGDMSGASMAQMNVDHGERRNSAAAFLSPAVRKRLDNLVVVTGTLCKRLLLEGKKAVGVELIPANANNASSESPTKVRAMKEIILTAGSFGSPQILLLSGIGPSSELSRHGIQQLVDSPGVGRNFRDHTVLPIEVLCDPSIACLNQLLHDEQAMAAARKEYDDNRTGPLSVFGASMMVAWTKLPSLFQSKEFQSLPEEMQAYLQDPERPSTEVCLHGGPIFYRGTVDASDSVIASIAFSQNLISRGTVSLESTDPRDHVSVDPQYLTEEWDWRVVIETVKLQLQLLKTPAISAIARRPLCGPGSKDSNGNVTLCSQDDEAAIREYIREYMEHGYHAMNTCTMGNDSATGRVVDTQFRVLGVEGLRVADMSVCPVLTNNHTQVNAYLIGERCAQCILGDDGKEAYASRF